MLLMVVERPKLVSLGSHGPDVLVVVHLYEDDPELLGQPLQEK